MAGLNIPGVTDQYKTNDTIEKLMQVERIPLVREQKQLDSFKAEKDAWRSLNLHLTSLRDKTKTLYSFDNPFNNKLTSSTDENAVTAEANRGAELQDFKIDVLQPATSDRFLTDELPSDYKVASGTYIFKVADKSVNMNWKGGSLKDFSAALNRRSNGVVKSMIIGASGGKKSLLIEAIETGKENRLTFEKDAKQFAEDVGMIVTKKTVEKAFGTKSSEIKPVNSIPENTQRRLPVLSLANTQFNNGKVTVNPRGAYQVQLPSDVKGNSNLMISFSIKSSDTQDITENLNNTPENPDLPDPGFVEFKGIKIDNIISDPQYKFSMEKPETVFPVSSNTVAYAVFDDGTEKAIEIPSSGDELQLKLSDYPGLKAVAFKNENTGRTYEISSFTAYNTNKDIDYIPKNAISEADDAIIKYEGIKITRPSNKIDDVVPEVTLNIHDKTEKTATISIKPDVDASKDALIQFIGEYNQSVAEINILSQNKPEIIEELEYLSEDDKEKKREQLGMFQTDFSLTSIKSNMQSIVNASNNFSDSADVTMLSQIGIATNASGFSGSYSQSKLRGYLEIDEKKLDEALKNHLDDIKQMFGYDSDGDLIVDSGIAYKLDKQISAYTQTGGILALKTSTLDSKIKSSETKISKLEASMDDKEASLRIKYGQMEGTLGSLESQQNAISNFTKQNRN